MKRFNQAIIVLGSLFLSSGYAQSISDATSPVLAPYVSCQKATDAYYYKTSDNWLFIDGELRTEFPELVGLLPKVNQLASELKAEGITLIPLILPIRPQVAGVTKDSNIPALKNYDRLKANTNYSKIVDSLNVMGIPTPDLVKAMENQKADMFFRGDHHITPDGGRVIAQAAARIVKGLPIYQTIPKMNFVTSAGKRTDHPDPGHATTLSQLCGPQPRENFILYQTTPVDGNTGLLDDATPQIIYAGTSIGRNLWNLPGFLKQYMSTDIDDQHIEAGGVFTSILNYFYSKNYKTSKPKIILWEWPIFESFYDRDGALPFSSSDSFSQVLPAVFGQCSPINTLFTLTKDGSTSTVFDLNRTIPLGRQSYLHLQFDDLSLTKADISFINGKTVSKQSVPLATRLTNKGELNVLVPEKFTQISSITVDLPQVTGKISVQICKSPVQ